MIIAYLIFDNHLSFCFFFTLNSNLTPKVLNVQPNADSNVSYQYANVTQYGKVVIATFRVQFAEKPSGYFTVYSNLPIALAKNGLYAPIMSLGGDGGLVAVNASGDILVNPNAAGIYFIQVSYICE